MKLKKINLNQSRIIFVLLISLSLFFFFLSFRSVKKEKKVQVSHITIKTTITSSPPPSITLTPTFIPAKKGNSKIVIMTPVPTTHISVTASSTNSSSQPQISVHLTINNGVDLSVSLPPGSTQCDVLNEALKQGKISSLNMKYNDSLKTYGVYQINGIGSDSQIWWTYKVNGKSPPQGCSYIKAENNDSVSWLYIGS